MGSKTEQIIHAALQVFARKGYKDSTTLEIAEEAHVAEVTLFRKFKTKQNLFVSAIQSVLFDKFEKFMLHSVERNDTETFFFDLLNDRLLIISKHRLMIKALLSESLMGHLEPKIDLPAIMFRTLQTAMENHFGKKTQAVNIEHLARVISGLLLSYLIWSPSVPFHQMIESERSSLLIQYIKMLKPYWQGLDAVAVHEPGRDSDASP